MSNKAIIIFSGYNQRAVISFCRTLNNTSVTFAIIASGPDDTILLSAYKKHVIYTRKIKSLDIDEIQTSLSLAKKHTKKDQLVIAPSTEAINRFFLEHKKEFANHLIPLVNLKLYKSISDKEKFTQLCQKYDISTPPTYNHGELNSLPVVAKHKIYQNTLGATLKPILIFEESDLTNFNDTQNCHDYFYQKFITGQSIYFLYYFTKNKSYFNLVQKNVIQQHDGGSMLGAVCVDSAPHQEEIKKYANLFIKEGFQGLVMVEVKHNKNKHYMIEANPRFWGPSQLFIDSHYNLFDAFLADIGLSSFNLENGPILGTHYLWSGGTDDIKRMVYHDYCYSLFSKQEKQWLDADIYNRPDTKDIYLKEKQMNNNLTQLISLYDSKSKHSNYQILPSQLAKILPQSEVNTLSRYERERKHFITQHVSFKEKSVLDIGGNSGYFCFESIAEGAQKATLYEGNTEHCEFVKLASEAIELNTKIEVINQYYDFTHNTNSLSYDIVFLLNVLHHIGDDYGQSCTDIEKSKNIIKQQLNSISKIANTLVFQLGFNLHGNTKQCLFEHGSKAEMIDFIKHACQGKWNIKEIGIAQKNNEKIVYQKLNDENIKRDNSLGEFLNRPIFILQKCCD